MAVFLYCWEHSLKSPGNPNTGKVHQTIAHFHIEWGHWMLCFFLSGRGPTTYCGGYFALHASFAGNFDSCDSSSTSCSFSYLTHPAPWLRFFNQSCLLLCGTTNRSRMQRRSALWMNCMCICPPISLPTRKYGHNSLCVNKNDDKQQQ